jgi:hypothetical protein
MPPAGIAELEWCREGEFIFWRPNFSSVKAKFGLINSFGVARRGYLGLI